MSRPLRLEFEGAFWHITSRGNERKDIFLPAGWRPAGVSVPARDGRHLFQRRYKSILVDEQNYLNEVRRYTVLNPVRAGMVAGRADYRWSSYRSHVGLDPIPDWRRTDDRGQAAASRQPSLFACCYPHTLASPSPCPDPGLSSRNSGTLAALGGACRASPRSKFLKR